MPIPSVLPKRCKQCNEVLRWVPEVLWDRALRADKVDHYRAESSCGEVYYYDGRGQPVEPATPNLAPDTSEVAQSPMGLIPYADARDHYATLQRGGREGTDGEGAAQERPARPAAAPPRPAPTTDASAAEAGNARPAAAPGDSSVDQAVTAEGEEQAH